MQHTMAAPTYTAEQLQHIIKELEGVGAEVQDDHAWMLCPFHGEYTPSLRVNLEENGYPYGAFYCFGCKESGGWNKLAKQANMKGLDGRRNVSKNDVFAILPKIENLKIEQESVGEDRRKFFGRSKHTKLTPWSAAQDWRGIPGSLVRAVGGMSYFDRRSRELMLWLPVNVNGKAIGGIHCALHSDVKKKYVNDVDDGTKWGQRALFPYDYVRRKFASDVIFLVEGPRDALHWLAHGLPALSLAGSAFTGKKADLVYALDPDLIVGAYDPDKAGQTAMDATEAFCFRKKIPFVEFEFPNGTDPADMTARKLAKVRRDFNLPERRGF